jgi:hypothetical protein
LQEDTQRLAQQDAAIAKLDQVAALFEKIDVQNATNVDVLKKVLGQVIELKQVATSPLTAT